MGAQTPAPCGSNTTADASTVSLEAGSRPATVAIAEKATHLQTTSGISAGSASLSMPAASDAVEPTTSLEPVSGKPLSESKPPRTRNFAPCSTRANRLLADAFIY
jgi:type VI secretion system protein ImpL